MNGKGPVIVAHYCPGDSPLARRPHRQATHSGRMVCLAHGGGRNAEWIMSGPVYTISAF